MSKFQNAKLRSIKQGKVGQYNYFWGEVDCFNLISLAFVTAAMVEFAGIMYLQRKNELKKCNQVSIEGELLRSDFEMMKL